MAANYGWALSVLNSDKSLKALFNRAVAKTYSPARFVAELRNTPWFKKHGEAWRKDSVLQKTDPATWRQNYNSVFAHIHELSSQMGASTPAKAGDQIARHALAFGWSDEQLKATLSGYVTTFKQSGHFSGQAGQQEDTLRQLASRNGVTISDKSLKGFLRSIAAGNSSVEVASDWIRKQAMTTFPGFSDQIQAGVDVADLASPYMQSMGQILEVNPNQITLQDPTIRQALQHKGADGKLAQQPLYEFEQGLRQDSRWLKTKNA